MQTYHIEIQETLVRVVGVEALSLDSAIVQVQEMYNNEEIVLDSDDYMDTEFLEKKTVPADEVFTKAGL